LKLDNLFVEFVRWLFRLPAHTGRTAILSSFAKRCAKCDAIFLAACQIATAHTTRNTVWADAVCDLRQGRLSSPWFQVTTAELTKRGFAEEVLDHGVEFLSEKRRRGVEFSQYCFHEHLNCPVGNSADEFRRLRQFGIYPFLLSLSPEQTRYLFSFITSSWRFLDGQVCSSFPEVCFLCDQENSSVHLLFFCPSFSALRSELVRATGQVFSVNTLATTVRREQLLLAKFGRDLFHAVSSMCR
jgi:hypothetical protein